MRGDEGERVFPWIVRLEVLTDGRHQENSHAKKLLVSQQPAMGAEQSSSRASGGQEQAVTQRKTCYYELLGVERTATDEEIRRAYKKKALELHPDRNINDVENSTRKFAEVQTAYEVLSDAQERAWYDSHRDAILGVDPSTEGGDAPGGHYNMRITTTEEIYTLMGRFNSSVPLNDRPNGFFAILDVFFGQLAAEETAACEWDGLDAVEYPPFGSSTDDYDPVARTFYNVWAGFSTRKSFSWKDEYRPKDASDRRIRRMIEKENRKFRDEGIREFNDAVRSLVAFVKKRDPRYVLNTQSEAERQKVLRDSAAAQAARSRAANRENLAEYVLPQWATSRNGEDVHDGEFSASEEVSEVEHIECVVCDKTFKSERQFEAHEKSKKHIKAVQQLRRQMKKENMDLDLELDLDEPSTKPTSVAGSEPVQGDTQRGQGTTASSLSKTSSGKEEEKNENENDNNDNDEDEDENADEVDEEDEKKEDDDDDENSDYASMDKIMDRIAGEGKSEDHIPSFEDLTLEGSSEAKKVGMAKQKREKKAARQAAVSEQVLRCTLCGDSFPSRTKLFAHLNQEHPSAKGSKGAKKGKR